MPVTFQPRRSADRVTARMTAFRPGASPPPVLTRMCMDPTPYRGLTLTATGRVDYSMFLQGFRDGNLRPISRRSAQCGDQHGSPGTGSHDRAEVHTIAVAQPAGVQGLLGRPLGGHGTFFHDDDVVAVRRGQVRV